MRNIKMGLITLAASAAILVPATSATAVTQNTAASSSLSNAPCIVGAVGCFDIYIDDVLSHNDVDVNTAISFCGVQVQALAVGQFMNCGGGKKAYRQS